MKLPIIILACCICVAIVAANSPETRTGPELLHLAHEAFTRGDLDTAEALYARAESIAADPGFVAFNRGHIFFARKNYREAEVHFTRSLDDLAAPAERRANAWYNRGVCLLYRKGADEYRAAIESFERSLKLLPLDSSLRADALQNLELAKILWNAERAAAPETPPPNTPPKESPPEKPKKPEAKPDPKSTAENTSENPNSQQPKPKPGATETPKQPGTNPTQTDQQTAGKGNLEVLLDEARKMQLSDADARAYLQRIETRLQQQRRDAAKPGPERPHVKDW